jgi:acetylornithine/N-succinyldiaminopimelate aminotransferase
MTNAHSKTLEDQFTLPTLPGGARLPFSLVRGEGCFVYDEADNAYLDLYGGHAVSLLGHSHPRWVEALSRQAATFSFYSTICPHPARGEAAELLVQNSYDSMARAFFCNSGAEANEAALKLARRATGRSLVLATERSFHGRTMGALSVTHTPKLHGVFPENLTDKTRFVPFGALAAVQSVPAEDVAAIIIEPIQSVAGVYVAERQYYRDLRDYCTAKGIVLIFDEVQTGSGRTGEWYVGRHWDVEPDIVSTAKGVAGGFPAGAVLVNDSVAQTVQPADHASTFGGGPLASVCIAETYRVVRDEGLVEKVARLSKAVVAELQGMVGKGLVSDVRGLGYLLGVQCEVPARDVLGRLLAHGVLVGTSGEPNTFRLLPPLTLEEEHWSRFLESLEKVACSL